MGKVTNEISDAVCRTLESHVDIFLKHVLSAEGMCISVAAGTKKGYSIRILWAIICHMCLSLISF